jgi:CubicO group peptidase (beta-lactamase class C family)
MLWLGAIAAGIGACNGSGPMAPEPTARTLAEFTDQVEAIRVRLGIPGLAGVVMSHDTVVWEGLLGRADLSTGRAVTLTTQFHLASLTKPFASTIVLQLVEQGLVSLDDPVSKYGVALSSSGTIRVRHLLSHTSEGTPGDTYRYNGDRFALLDQVIERATGEPFAKRVVERIINPLALEHTAPNPRSAAAFAFANRDVAAFTAAMAQGYGLNAQGPQAVAYPVSFSTAAGLVSTPREVARYSVALDAGQFLAPATRELAYTPAVGGNGATLPYGLGWFISTVGGQKLVWHYGYWTGNSSLIIKVPARALTFVVLTNSDQLSAPFNLGAGDLLSSSMAQAFVNGFVTGPLPGR